MAEDSRFVQDTALQDEILTAPGGAERRGAVLPRSTGPLKLTASSSAKTKNVRTNLAPVFYFQLIMSL